MEGLENGRLPYELPEKLRVMMEEPPSECVPLAREACRHLLLRDTVRGGKRFFCTVCNKTFEIKQMQTVSDETAAELYYAKHNDESECLLCSARGAVIEGKRWALDRHTWYAPLCVRVQLEGEWQATLCFEVRRRLFYDGVDGFGQALTLAKEDVYLLGRGVAGHYKYYWYCQRFYLHKKIDGDGSKIRGGFGAPLASHTESTGRIEHRVQDILPWNCDRDILRYMPKDMMERLDPCAAMASFACFPQIEMLWKAGYRDIVEEFVGRGKKCVAICRLDGGSFREVFPKFTREELRRLSELKMLKVYQMERYLKLRKIYGSRIKLAFEVLEALEKHFWDREEVLRETRAVGVEPHLLIRYLNRIVEAGKVKKDPQTWERYVPSAYTHWRDYIQAARAIGLDLAREDVVFPKKLGARHDMATKLHRELLAKQQEEELAHLWENNEARYGFSNGEFVVVNPKSTTEIIDEGKAQQHCVAGYAERHAKGVLTIVFIRRVGEEDKALITVEMRKDKMWQARGKKNRYPDAHERAFIDKWLAVVKERFNSPKETKRKRKDKAAEAVGVGA